MKVLTDLKVATFSSWEASHTTSTLTAISSAAGVMLVLGNEYKETQAVELSQEEASAISEDMQKLLTTCGQIKRREDRVGAETSRQVEGSDLVVSTRINTAGEPYREGVTLKIRNTEYKEFLYIDFEGYTCHEFAKFLKAPA